MSRAIVHLDADAFFASVEQAADPRLRGKPIAVGGEKRGIVASASYEARKFGVYTPMPTVRARKLCPKLIVVPGDFDKYERFSRWMFSYVYDFTPDVEISSIDEGYFDLSAAKRPAVRVAETVREAIRQSLKITVSEGIAVNKLVSQIASKLNKPAAFLQVPPGMEIPFLHPLPNRWLPGIGPHTAARLNAAGLAQIQHIALTPLELLELLLGRMARITKQYANALDDRPVVPLSVPAKSFSHQETFATDLTDEEYIEAVLRQMADRLMTKVRQESKSIRTFTVKVRYNDMEEDQCGESLAEPTDLETDLYTRLGILLRRAWRRRVSLRMVSLKLSNVYEGALRTELPLGPGSQQQSARQQLVRVVDQLRHDRGHGVILRGHDFRLLHPPRAPSRPGPSPGRPVRSRRQGPPASERPYVPLNVRSYYSFLNSTLSVDAVVGLAVKYGLPAIALADQGNLHGAVEFAAAARKAGIKPLVAASVQVEASELLLFVESTRGYHHLCRLLSMERRASDSRSHPGDEGASVAAHELRPFRGADLEGRTDGLLGVSADDRLAGLFPGRFYHAVSADGASDQAGSSRFPQVIGDPVHYAAPADAARFNIIQSIRTRTLLDQAHPAKRLHGGLHFRSSAEWAELLPDAPRLFANTLELAERCSFEIACGRPQFPEFKPRDGSSARAFLRRLVEEGVRARYGSETPKVARQVAEELAIIAEVGYEEYFLVMWDILQECERRGIEWITRGSAADSLVCYCLGISDVCPIRFDLYFRRFLNRERMGMHKLPDIDVDFAHDRKDEVVELIFQKFGADYVAVVGGFSTYRARAAVADVGKVLGLSEGQVRRFTEHIPWADPTGLYQTLKGSIECRDLPLDEEPYRTAMEMAEFLEGFPRHPKMHPCGIVLSRQPMLDLTPTFRANKGYATTHFEMESVEAIGLVKMDILAQGGLAAMRDARASLGKRGLAVDLRGLQPWKDEKVWEMIASGGGRAVHHIESPAMVSLCRMSNVRDIDGLIAIVSVIRPGAANASKKSQFTRRYQRLETVTYPHPSLEECLRSTFGLVVYEEHVLQICEAFAGLPAGRADMLRRALSKQKVPVIREIKGEFIACARARGHPDDKIAEVWQLLTGFAGYAFCKAHSTAYGVEAYQAAWLKCYHPVEFMAAVLSNGKGFYHPLVYVLECHRLGMELLCPSLNQPGPNFEPSGRSIRVPVTRVSGLSERTRLAVVAERRRGPFCSLPDFYQRVGPTGPEMEAMIRVGTFDELGESRPRQFWQAQALMRSCRHSVEPGQGWLLPPPGLERLPEVPWREPTLAERLGAEVELLDFPVSAHPLRQFEGIAWETYCPVARLGEYLGQQVVTCGLVIEQRTFHQVTGELMKFLTLADWTGMVETELFAPTYRTYGLATVRYPVLEVTATVEPFDNGRGFSLRVHRAGPPRKVG